MAARIASMADPLLPIPRPHFPSDHRERLKQKATLRPGLLRRLKEQETRTVYKRNGRIERVRPPKKVSRSHKTRLRAYYALQTMFLSQPENRDCLICKMRRERGENIRQHAAIEVHHWAGRIGRLLCYVPYFRASCFECRQWPHEHPIEAREMGLLAPPALWNVFPGGG